MIELRKQMTKTNKLPATNYSGCHRGSYRTSGELNCHARLRTGAAAVEFSLVATVLFFFVIGSVEFSRISILRQAMDNASYEAARIVIVPGATVAEAQDRVLC